MATVSRVLAGNYPTSATARAKVLRAVRDLDHVVDGRARALAGTGPKTVAVIVMSVDSPFYASVAQGVEQEAAAGGRLCMVCSHGGDEARELALVQMMREQRAEFVVLVGGAVEDERYRARLGEYAYGLAAAGSRLVLCGRPAPGPETPVLVVEYDNEAGAYALVSHLLSAGHRNILYLGRLPGHTTVEPRIAGYRRALADHGLGPGAERIGGWGFGRDHGYASMRQILAECDGRPDFTAVFAGDDRAAAGAMAALRERGLRTPEDVSVVGYNDDALAQDLNPPLTTVRIPAYEPGREAVRLGARRGAARRGRRAAPGSGGSCWVRTSCCARRWRVPGRDGGPYVRGPYGSVTDGPGVRSSTGGGVSVRTEPEPSRTWTAAAGRSRRSLCSRWC
ncbi:LacI family DNA-binding transcriptional regulator [Actinacidiphila sp. ITFR-21]|uniref:LacI family DNA-binding transcriptional regulator n=1 Tax=Actinacidiphila sp. ITFR-21 TaxID=3075199 RepID=UPI00288A1ED0|nr:LacI family DNA-binding transcriptional regulator [Streptomyces sp. ITFR-21]WNI16975.1 LacI family DNA-binding transcriptional regulator [Streptomyces sp. ITFR-21]